MASGLFELMEHYDFREITVTQIAQEAELSRKTFYRLFDRKEDILNYSFGQWFQTILDRIRDEQMHSYWYAVQCYFDLCEQYKDRMALLKRQQILKLFFEFIEQNAVTVFEYIHSKKTAENYRDTLPYFLAYSVGGMFSMLEKWVENDMDVPSEKLLSILKNGYMSPKF